MGSCAAGTGSRNRKIKGEKNMKIKAVPVNEENFKPYGIYTRIIRGEARTGEGGWRAWTSPGLAMEHNAHFGMTKVAGMPFSVDSMERHTKSTELLVCGDKPIVLAVADSDPAGKAKAEDIRAFIINPGEFVVLNYGIWHDACRCAEGDHCYYYFLSLETDEPAVFQPIEGEPVDVEL